MSNKLYDVLKWIVVIVLPACATLYAALSAIWGLPFAEQVPSTINAVGVFLGVVLMISSAQHNNKA